MRASIFIILSLAFCVALYSEAAEPKTTVEIIVQASSEDDGYEAYLAMDGNVQTMWHTQWRHALPLFPHTLTLDLTAEHEISGFKITPRTDNWNGVIQRYEVFFGNDAKQSAEPILQGEFPREQTPQNVLFDEPLKGRFFTIKVLSGHGTDSYASIAELELFCDTAVFNVKKMSSLQIQLDEIQKSLENNTNPESLCEFIRLIRDIKLRVRFDKIAEQTFMPESLIHDTDRDPADIAYRRTAALLADIKTMPNAPDLAEQQASLDALQKQVETVPVEQLKERFALFTQIAELRREIAFANPLLNFDELLFVKRHRATFNHMCDQFYGINSLPGGGVFILENPFSNNPVVRNLLENSVVQSGRLEGQTLSTGSFVSPNLCYDAERVAFAYVECTGDTEHRFHTDPTQGHWHEGRSFHIFTCNIDGSDLRQITDGTWNDFDPCWLPNGRIVFISERRGGYLRCGRECPTYTLFGMNPDGAMMRCLSYHETNEWNPSVTNDGRILYTRWDYPDRHGCTAHHPWTTTLDGRDPRQVYGNFTPRFSRSDMELGSRAIPHSPKFVVTAAPHHGQMFGTLNIIDPQVPDDDAMAPVKRLTPDVDYPETQGGAQVYGTPYPLSEKYYLAVADFAMTPNTGFQAQPYVRGDYGIYLVDAFGNKELVYRDPEIGSVSPMPVVARPMPPVMPRMVSDAIEEQPYLLPDREKLTTLPQATISVVNAYQSLRPFPEGTKLKEIRVIQWIPMSVPSGSPPHEIGVREPTSMDSVVLARYVLGTAPIEDDGSANITVPPRRPLQLQVLDEDGLAVQSMRGSVYLHDGETLSCHGCHEPVGSAPIQTTVIPRAFLRAPSELKPAHPDANPFSYPRLIQPIWDKHCVACHTEERAKGTAGVPNLAKEPITRQWYASYNELVPKYGFYSYGEPLRTMPGAFGARASKLYPHLKSGHKGVELSREELERIVLWLDCVSVFYGVYEKEGGEAQLRGERVYPTLE